MSSLLFRLLLGKGGGGGAQTQFDPLSLFSGGSDGMLYDPQKIETLFQDVGGTTPVTADGQLVARINDRSGNGYHMTQATAANRYKFREVNGVRWLDSEGRVCSYDSGKKITGGWSYGVALKLDTIAASVTLIDSGAGSEGAVNALYLRHGSSDQNIAHVERAASVGLLRLFDSSVGNHFAMVGLVRSTGTSDFFTSPSYESFSLAAKLGVNTTSGTGMRLGPTGAASVRFYGVFFVNKIITDEQRSDALAYLTQIGETEARYIWVGAVQ